MLGGYMGTFLCLEVSPHLLCFRKGLVYKRGKGANYHDCRVRGEARGHGSA